MFQKRVSIMSDVVKHSRPYFFVSPSCTFSYRVIFYTDWIGSSLALYCSYKFNLLKLTSFRYLSSTGPQCWIYLLWNAIFAQLTSRVKIFWLWNLSISSLTQWLGPDIVQLFGLFLHAISISGGSCALSSSYESPADNVVLG